MSSFNETNSFITTESALNSDPYLDLTESIDTLWISIATYLILFMQAGFSLVEVGTVRAKNAQNILLKNIIDITIATVTWWLIGYGIAFGFSNENFIGGTKYGGTGFNKGTHYRDWLFQWAFAGTASTIVSGALAERTKILAYAVFSLLLTSFIYPFIVHWVWDPKGWLFKLGYLDFAGSGVIHMTGGIAALLGAFFVGPRIGRFDSNSKMNFRPHNVPLLVTGVFILWFGWYGFNCGSTLGITGDNTVLVSVVGMNTSLGAAAGGLFGLLADILVQIIQNEEDDFELKLNIAGPLTNGILAGLVAITAGCAFIKHYAAFIIGGIGGVICYFSSILLQLICVDDPLDAFSVHGVNGAFGVFALGLFHTEKGVFYGGNGKFLGKQLLGIAAIAFWTIFWAGIIFYLMNKFEWLRVPRYVELQGLDKFEHGGSAYSIKSTKSILDLVKKNRSSSKSRDKQSDDENDGTNETQGLTKKSNKQTQENIEIEIVETKN